jgi:hypothetical protein
MEAFSALEDERERRNHFKHQLESEITQVRRDSTSASARSLILHLEESRFEIDRLLNDVQDRLFRFIDATSQKCEGIEQTRL